MHAAERFMRGAIGYGQLQQTIILAMGRASCTLSPTNTMEDIERLQLLMREIAKDPEALHARPERQQIRMWGELLRYHQYVLQATEIDTADEDRTELLKNLTEEIQEKRLQYKQQAILTGYLDSVDSHTSI